MSHSVLPTNATGLHSILWGRIRPVWHACCFVFSGGCLYVPPVQRPDVNHAPDIEVPTSLNNTLQVVSSPERIVLVAWDQDGDALEFFWGGLPSAFAGTPIEPTQQHRDDGVVLWIAGYELPWHEELQGRTLDCVVSDLDQDVTVRWQLEVETP